MTAALNLNPFVLRQSKAASSELGYWKFFIYLIRYFPIENLTRIRRRRRMDYWLFNESLYPVLIDSMPQISNIHSKMFNHWTMGASFISPSLVVNQFAYYESKIQLRCYRDRSGACRVHRGIPAGVKRFQGPDSRQKYLPQRKNLRWAFDMENRKTTGKHLPNNHRFSEIWTNNHLQ